MEQIIKKANSILRFLHRNLMYVASNEEIKSEAYFYMVRPILEYISIVWSPYTMVYIHKFRMVQPEPPDTSQTVIGKLEVRHLCLNILNRSLLKLGVPNSGKH